MTNSFKYLPVSEEDVRWGLYALNAGYNRIGKAESYPTPGHPSDHNFNWNKGRILEEYQLIYITRGEGIFESKSYRQVEVKEGTVILLFPGEWHRFKPNNDTGWDEFWVGFKGDIISNIVHNRFISPDRCVLQIGVHDHVISLFSDIIEKTRTEQPGYQALVAGMVLHLLGDIYTRTKQEELKQDDISEALINKARACLRAYVNENVTIEKVAAELQVSYSWFRKAFKAYTGIAPHQYLLQLKVERAKALLRSTSKPVKEIAYELGFESSFYFSKLFKIKTKTSPNAYRRQVKL